jgi:hypothetical protein
MKRTILVLVWIAMNVCSLGAYAQVVPSATGNRQKLYIGGMFSVGEPDYAGNGIAESSPQKLYGAGVFADYKLSRWVQFQGEARWSRFHEYLGINQDTYLVGLREPFYYREHFIPYGKILLGAGRSLGLDKTATVYAMGGGLDYSFRKRLRLRLFDFEYQRWSVHPILHPYQGSIGISYAIR